MDTVKLYIFYNGNIELNCNNYVASLIYSGTNTHSVTKITRESVNFLIKNTRDLFIVLATLKKYQIAFSFEISEEII